ncbi:MAG: efflux RND transporter permease subunit [Clostridia bacterium]|nr:efflux RND transporter permease subunit [Clostridia bacterium]
MEYMSDLGLMLVVALLFIFLIMVAQFQSFKSPFIVMFTIPLAFTGGLLALIITKMDLSIIAMVGFLVLSGVVVNNGIVFVDSINQLRIGGMEKKEAIIETGRIRLRPILMTALTTILGMSTMALATGMGAEMMQPMAVVIVGGLSYSTLMTLFVVPVLYDLFNGKQMKAREIEMMKEAAGVHRDGFDENEPATVPTATVVQAPVQQKEEPPVQPEVKTDRSRRIKIRL